MRSKSESLKIQRRLKSHEKWVKSGGKEGKRATLSGLDLRGFDLSGMDLQGIVMNRAILDGVICEKTILDHAECIGSSCVGTQFKEASCKFAKFRGSVFAGSKIYSSNFSYSDMNMVDFTGSIMCSPKFNYAKLQHSNMGVLIESSGLDLHGAEVSQATLPSGSFILLGEAYWLMVQQGRFGTTEVSIFFPEFCCDTITNDVERWKNIFEVEKYVAFEGSPIFRAFYPRLLQIIDFYTK